jgi:hypothetical protein
MSHEGLLLETIGLREVKVSSTDTHDFGLLSNTHMSDETIHDISIHILVTS